MPEATAPSFHFQFGAAKTDAVSVEAGDVVRHLSHELRQPLSTIDSIAYYLGMILPGDSKAVVQAKKLHTLVEQMNWVLTDAVHLLQAAPVNPKPLDLHELISEAVAGHGGDGVPPFRTELGETPALVQLDAGQARHLMRSMVLILGEAARGSSEAVVRTVFGEHEVAVEFRMPGLEIDQHELDRLLEPMATGLVSGGGLSLAGARKIVQTNGGRMAAVAQPGSGTTVRMALPLAN